MTYHRYDPQTCGASRGRPAFLVATLASFVTGALLTWAGSSILPNFDDVIVSRSETAHAASSDAWRRARLAVPANQFVKATSAPRFIR